jgi:hypothetical protein
MDDQRPSRARLLWLLPITVVVMGGLVFLVLWSISQGSSIDFFGPQD